LSRRQGIEYFQVGWRQFDETAMSIISDGGKNGIGFVRGGEQHDSLSDQQG